MFFEVPEIIIILIAFFLIGVSVLGYVYGRIHMQKSKTADQRSAAIRDNSRDAVFYLSEEGIITEANPAAGKMIGAPGHDLKGRPLGDFLKAYDTNPETVLQPEQLRKFSWFEFLRQSQGLNCTGLMERADKSHFPADFFIQRIGVSSECAYFVHLSDITDRCRMEEDLKREKNFISSVLEILPSLVVVFDKEGKILEFNRACEQLTGYDQEEVRGKSILSLFIPKEEQEELHKKVSEVLINRTENVVLHENHWIKRGGEKRLISWSNTANYDEKGNFLYGIASGVDITDKKKAEEELRKKEKLESISLLVGGVAHDFNNILTALIGNISLAKFDSSGDPALEGRLEKAEKASLRARNLARQLLNVVKDGSPVREVVGLTRIIPETVQFALHGSNIKADIELPKNLPQVNADPSQISQIFENLTINAKQAMPGGGHILIRGKTIPLLEIESRSELPEPLNDKYVKITFTDNGPGIEPEVKERIFQPYFTTKARGSGIGLTNCYSIAKNHRGLLKVDSTVGEGTVFTLYLPAEDVEEKVEAEQETRIEKGSGHVLVVDDEVPIRRLLKEMLTGFGYRFTGAKDGPQAIKKFKEAKEHQDPVDIVIMDLTIPGEMSGTQTMAELRKSDPDLIGLLSSGYPNSEPMRKYSKYGFAGAVAKPYSVQEIMQALQAIQPANSGDSKRGQRA
ncbi:MAG: PAS domain S-box protein [Opitutales bacterium]|nr:PAS domain S-box protein [Opitutales bacterium]MCH8540179.1 PAS domain S-box protein [Opitutales bacterium]